MKKLIAIILATAALFMLASCGNSKNGIYVPTKIKVLEGAVISEASAEETLNEMTEHKLLGYFEIGETSYYYQSGGFDQDFRKVEIWIDFEKGLYDYKDRPDGGNTFKYEEGAIIIEDTINHLLYYYTKGEAPK